ncbi:unnamed protein product [Blepharisma stoltei]|uniref:Nudix hydrolase domain-containing protein n=1 Tax=Blepharisma stoltei TaxID=1481888 RepID=A0AAU9IJH3_9CILI|nr:unnamed protein product [Blepharisma stoltei]
MIKNATKVIAGLKQERLSSSIILCRPHNNHFQVLMIKRKSSMSFSNALVFPGGALEKYDTDPRWANIIETPSEEIQETAYSQKIDLKSLMIGAIRETWEEVGILLANKTISRTQTGEEFLESCLKEGSRPEIEKLHYFNRLITPLNMPNRFDTVFFLAVLEADREVQLDTNESDYYLWAEPKEFISKHIQKEIILFPPQACALSTLSKFQNLSHVIDYTRRLRKIPTLVDLINNTYAYLMGDYRNQYTPDHFKQSKGIHCLELGKTEIRYQVSPDVESFLMFPSERL